MRLKLGAEVPERALKKCCQPAPDDNADEDSQLRMNRLPIQRQLVTSGSAIHQLLVLKDQFKSSQDETVRNRRKHSSPSSMRGRLKLSKILTPTFSTTALIGSMANAQDHSMIQIKAGAYRTELIASTAEVLVSLTAEEQPMKNDGKEEPLKQELTEEDLEAVDVSGQGPDWRAHTPFMEV